MDLSKCVPPCSELELEGNFLHFLRNLELSLRLCFDSFSELRINSAFRTSEYEKSMGRTGDSTHCLGKAVDIHCTNNSHRHHIVSYALKNGITRIGIYKNFIHLDAATYKDKKAEFVIWYG